MKADIKEYDLSPKVLNALLHDNSSNANILWGCVNYDFPESSQILYEQVCDGRLIKPRFEKTKEVSSKRQKKSGEVFTPIAIIKKQNDLVDMDFHGTWQDYVARTVMEVTCGEAPYLTNRYDVITGEVMMPYEAEGLLDRKLKKISENCNTPEEWKTFGKIALKSTYGYEWQGDSLLIARENILVSWKTFFKEKFNNEILTEEEELELAEIIAYNIFQMDALTYCIPYSQIPVRVMNWETNVFEKLNANVLQQNKLDI